jgi:hypothetical protein
VVRLGPAESDGPRLAGRRKHLPRTAGRARGSLYAASGSSGRLMREVSIRGEVRAYEWTERMCRRSEFGLSDVLEDGMGKWAWTRRAGDQAGVIGDGVSEHNTRAVELRRGEQDVVAATR